jgi:hypothetical protein
MSVPRTVVALALSIALAACGGGSSPDDTTEDDAFRIGAETACADFNEVVPDEEQKYSDVSQAIAQVKKVLAQYEKTVGALSELNYPTDSPSAELRRILVIENQKELDEMRAATVQIEQAVASNNQGEYYEAADRFIALGESPGPDRKGVLHAYGFIECDRAFGPKK